MLLLGGCGASQSVPPSPAVSAVPSGTPIDLALADQLYGEGESDQAIRIYSAAALHGTADQKQEAVWKLARIQYKQGEHGAAAQNAQAFLGTAPLPEAARRAYLLLGYSEMAQGDIAAAKRAFETYVGSEPSPAAPYARLQLAEIASRQGDKRGALEQARSALSDSLPEPARTQTLFALARYEEADGDVAATTSTYERLAADGEREEDRAEALWLLAQLVNGDGEAQKFQEMLHSLIVQYPSQKRALEALAESELATPGERALVLFRQRQNDQARDAYQALLTNADAAVQGEAHYYLGVLAERAGDPAGAIGEYQAAITALQGSRSPVLADAYWDGGLALESAGRLDEAADYFTAIAASEPASPHAAEGLFRAGLIRYRQGQPADAEAAWRRYLGVAGDEASRARGHFWLARAELLLGKAEAAGELRSAAVIDRLGYYGLRANALALGDAQTADPAQVPAADEPWTSVEQWLAQTFGREDAAASDAALAAAGWQRGQELLQAGLREQAEAEFGAIIDDTHPAWVRYRMARAMSEAGETQLAARAAEPLAAAQQDFPPVLLTLAYPGRFPAATTQAASESGVSPLFLLALVRQESFFDAAAVSPAGAIGLTQVIPGTARQIAGELDETSFRESDLLRASVSLRFGAHYLRSQLDAFAGSYPAALAAYNAGPGNAARWQAEAADPDVFLETIDFTETRLYVQRVLENYALYRYAFGIAEHPSLPLP